MLRRVYAPVFGRKRRVIRFESVSVCVRLRACRCWPVCFALKWFCPGFRATSFPFLVTLIRLVYDLFVFIIFFSLREKVVQLYRI